MLPERSDLIALLHDDASLGLRARIYRTCLDAILDGTLAPGARIPSARRRVARRAGLRGRLIGRTGRNAQHDGKRASQRRDRDASDAAPRLCEPR